MNKKIELFYNVSVTISLDLEGVVQTSWNLGRSGRLDSFATTFCMSKNNVEGKMPF